MIRFCWLLLCSLLPVSLHAQNPACKNLLAEGVFDKRNITTATANRDRLQYLFCSEQTSTRDQAKSLSASLKILDAVGANFGQSETDYQNCRSSVCSDLNTDEDSSKYLTDQSKVASKAILDAFNECVTQKGLTQHAESMGRNSALFLWIFHYTPYNEKVNAVNVHPVWTSPVSCTLYNKPAPASFLVGVGGKTLSCKRDPCKASVLAADSEEEMVPKTISSNPIDREYEVPFALVKTQTFNMTVPISIGDLPIDSECKETHEGAWHPHKYNTAYVLGCPDLIFGDGSASRNFDNIYDDNDGSCTYRFYCRARPPKTPSACEVEPSGARHSPSRKDTSVGK